MRTFVEYIKNYFIEEFHWQSHAIIGIFLAVCLYLNYGIQIGEYDSLYDEMVHANYKSLESIFYLLLFYATPLLFTLYVVRFSQKKANIINKKYILFGLIGILFLAVDSSYYIMQYANEWFSDNPFIYGWSHACFSNLSSTLTVIIPLFLIYAFTTAFKPELYGFKLNGARVKPYLWLILFMIPLIFLASLRPDFLDHYPTYTDHYEYEHLPLEQWQTVAIYEFTYGFDFISVELFFRGFMVVGLSRFIGRDAILPMVAVYCFLHFGKPAGEAVSSIFGGYALGILAYQSRNIFGGLIAHLGVAWGMEFLAFMQS
ncbi:MAG: CPBP family intramembrane metalloprotease [Crocinitomicaceae bacterium]|nr:CPBP family intramembrane metalloprotease [Crocinitomicaceae bacterium]